MSRIKTPIGGVVRDKNGRVKMSNPTIAKLRRFEHVLTDEDIEQIKADHRDVTALRDYQRIKPFTGKRVRR